MCGTGRLSHTPKDYAINSEIKYTDLNGDTVISESMKMPVVVNAASSSLILPAAIVLIIIIAAGGYIYQKKAEEGPIAQGLPLFFGTKRSS